MNQSPTTSVPGCANCHRLERVVHRLEQRIAELERQVNRHSGNSSVPPSSNPPWAPRPVTKKPTGRKPGGQPGHEGHYRQLLPVEQVDEVVKHEPSRCLHCGTMFTGRLPKQLIDRHQITELPRRAVKVTEHQAFACRCGRCGLLSKQPIPEALMRSVLGERLSAAVTFISSRVHGSRRAAEELLEDVLGAPLALGTVIVRGGSCGWRRRGRWRCFTWTPAAIAMRCTNFWEPRSKARSARIAMGCMKRLT